MNLYVYVWNYGNKIIFFKQCNTIQHYTKQTQKKIYTNIPMFKLLKGLVLAIVDELKQVCEWSVPISTKSVAILLMYIKLKTGWVNCCDI